MEKDPLDTNRLPRREQERCEWRATLTEDERRLAIELVYFGFQVCTESRSRHDAAIFRAPCSAAEVCNSCDAPAFCTSGI